MLLRASRPRFWLYLAGPVMVGAAFGAARLEDMFTLSLVLLLAYSLWPANLFLYGTNDLFDRETDALNPKKVEREERYSGGAALPVAVTISLILGLTLVAVLPAAGQPWLLAFIGLGALYSVPPFRLKARPALDSVSNVLYILPGVAAYALAANANPPLAALVGGALWTMAMHAFSAIPDIDSDSRAGVQTTATRLGERNTLAFCGMAWLGAAIAFATIAVPLGGLMAVYPALAAIVSRREWIVGEVYWRYPAINALVGTALTVAGLVTLDR